MTLGKTQTICPGPRLASQLEQPLNRMYEGLAGLGHGTGQSMLDRGLAATPTP